MVFDRWGNWGSRICVRVYVYVEENGVYGLVFFKSKI